MEIESNNPPVRLRAEWILRLLYAPGSGARKKQPIYGITRLMKATFLLHRKMEENFPDVKTGFDFRPDKYGPLDEDVYAAITYLENNGLIAVEDEKEHADQYECVKYSLTPEGAREARKLYESLPEGQQRLVDWIKKEHAMKPLGELLAYVYNQYPEMTTKSELA